MTRRNKRFDKPKRGSKYILLFGGADMNAFNYGTGSTSVYRYDIINDRWMELESFKLGRYKVGVALKSKCLLVACQPVMVACQPVMVACQPVMVACQPVMVVFMTYSMLRLLSATECTYWEEITSSSASRRLSSVTI